MDLNAFKLTEIINPQSINKNDYKFIATIKYEQEITYACLNLQQLLGVEYFSICLTLPNGRKQIISNNPGNIAIPYQINGLKRLDNIFDLSNYDNIRKDFFIANQLKYDSCANLYQQIMNERFHVFNKFGFIRKFDGYEFIMIFACKQQTQILSLHSSIEKNMLLFALELLDKILPLYVADNTDLKYSRFVQDNAFRKNFIYGKYSKNLTNLSHRECECLFWARYGKAAVDIASILGLKQSTVKHYLESIRDKFQGAALRPTIVGDLVPYRSFVIDWQFIH